MKFLLIWYFNIGELEYIYMAAFDSRHCIGPKTELEMTPLRQLVFLLDKMSKDINKRSWTKMESLPVLVST